ncbi:MAG: hypothetical protein FJ288_08375 [Planctomycetes bacterium]|nr:hypothetical protein [Planctomycetota bacterium]
MARFHHVGVPSKVRRDGETYLEGGKVHITDPGRHPYGFEYLRFERGSPLPKELQTMPHVAFMVESVEAALEGEKVVLPPLDATPELRVAFIMKDGVLIEVMQRR